MTAVIAEKVPGEDRLRADLYNFLGVLLSKAPDEMMLAQCVGLQGDKSDLGRAIKRLSRIARSMDHAKAEREFNALFIGLGRGELLPYASYYLTGFLNEKPLGLLRQDLRNLGITRSSNVFEPEDNIASLFEIMAALIVGRFNDPLSVSDQKVFFENHLSKWATHFFDDLEKARNSVFYSPVGEIGRIFMEIEREAFALVSDS